jgi:Flp pilus assembly protein TadG
MRFRSDAETGGVAAELVIVTPLLILFLLFVVALGRLAGSRIDLDGAANQAARAASIARDPVAATSAAQTTASAALADDHISCAHLDVTVDTAEFHPGGSVGVTVACTVELEDVTGLRIPSDKTLTARAVAPLDRYHGLGP